MAFANAVQGLALADDVYETRNDNQNMDDPIVNCRLSGSSSLFIKLIKVLFLIIEQTADHLGMAVSILNKLRCNGEKPIFVKRIVFIGYNGAVGSLMGTRLTPVFPV